MSQDWGNLLFKLSLAEALEEVATSITEEAWLYNENAFNICFLTSSLRHPKALVKEFSYFLMPCHQHCLGVNLLVQR